MSQEECLGVRVLPGARSNPELMGTWMMRWLGKPVFERGERMHPTHWRDWRKLAVVLLSFLVGGPTVRGQEPVPGPRPAAPPTDKGVIQTLVVPIGVSQTLQMGSKKAITAVRLNVEGIVRVAPNAVDTTSIILTGLSAGTARLFLTDVAGREEVYDVVVQLDVTYLKRIIAEAAPSANVDVKPVLNRSIILTGWVAKAEDVDVILRITQTVVGNNVTVVNAMQVGGVQQVQLDVVVAQVSRSEARRRGFAYAINGTEFSFGSILGGLATSLQNATGTGSGGTGVGVRPNPAGFLANTAAPNGANIVFGVVPWGAQFLLRALRDEQLAKLLAEPKLVTLSGRPAHFLSGGQQAILSAAGGLGGPGVTFRDVGTEVSFLPIVLGNGKIYLEVSPVVRSVNQGRGINTAFGFVPGFDEQSVRTALELEPGQTMAIGGLIQTTSTAVASRVPILGDIPFLGGAFNSVIHSEEETEVVILVTPYLVDGQDCHQAPKHLPGRETRSPDDYELFLEYLLEAPRGQRQVFENGKYKAAYKSDPSYQRFPCADPHHENHVLGDSAIVATRVAGVTGAASRPVPQCRPTNPGCPLCRKALPSQSPLGTSGRTRPARVGSRRTTP
jgi:pilus assembly protein CpaC